MRTRYPPLAHAQPTQTLETICVQQMRLIEERETIFARLVEIDASPSGRRHMATGASCPPENSSFGVRLRAQTASSQLQKC